jgi:integrase
MVRTEVERATKANPRTHHRGGQAVLEKLRPDYVPFVWFLAARGLRVRAAIGMQKFDVDLNRKTANVWKKGVGKVKVHLSHDQCTLIKEEIAKCPDSKAVWTYVLQRGALKGQRLPITYDGLRRVLVTALRRSCISDFHIHDLRHDFASKLLRSSRNLALIQKALGHSDIKSTVRYAHVLDDEVEEAMDAMAIPEFVPESGPSKKQGQASGLNLLEKAKQRAFPPEAGALPDCATLRTLGNAAFLKVLCDFASLSSSCNVQHVELSPGTDQM